VELLVVTAVMCQKAVKSVFRIFCKRSIISVTFMKPVVESESLRKTRAPRSACGSGIWVWIGCVNRPATAVLARRACIADAVSCASSSAIRFSTGMKTQAEKAVPSYTGAENLRKGKLLVPGLFEGDWARKYERIGELPGEGTFTFGAPDGDVGV
jgi:hypothetical protein